MVEPSLGSELVTNGDFSSNSDWTLGTGWSITNGKLVADGTNTGFENAQQNSLTVVGKTYKVTLTIEATSGQVELKGSGVYSRVDTLGVGTHTLTFVADATYFRFLAHAGATITIDNVSVKYAICDIELLDEVDAEGNLVFDFSKVLQSSRETIRVSNDGLLFIAKWIGETPVFLNDVDTYTHAEILVALQDDNWTTTE